MYWSRFTLIELSTGSLYAPVILQQSRSEISPIIAAWGPFTVLDQEPAPVHERTQRLSWSSAIRPRNSSAAGWSSPCAWCRRTARSCSSPAWWCCGTTGRCKSRRSTAGARHKPLPTERPGNSWRWWWPGWGSREYSQALSFSEIRVTGGSREGLGVVQTGNWNPGNRRQISTFCNAF